MDVAEFFSGLDAEADPAGKVFDADYSQLVRVCGKRHVKVLVGDCPVRAKYGLKRKAGVSNSYSVPFDHESVVGLVIVVADPASVVTPARPFYGVVPPHRQEVVGPVRVGNSNVLHSVFSRLEAERSRTVYGQSALGLAVEWELPREVHLYEHGVLLHLGTVVFDLDPVEHWAVRFVAVGEHVPGKIGPPRPERLNLAGRLEARVSERAYPEAEIRGALVGDSDRLRARRTRHHGSADLRRVDLRLGNRPHYYVDSLCSAQSLIVGRRESGVVLPLFGICVYGSERPPQRIAAVSEVPYVVSDLAISVVCSRSEMHHERRRPYHRISV